MNNHNMTQATIDTEIAIDATLLRNVASRRARAWRLIGPAIFAGVCGYQLLIQQQRYDAIASIAVQQGAMSSPLALLTGGSGTNTKYIGLLQSRNLAQRVNKQLKLQRFYHLDSSKKAEDLLMESVKPTDNTSSGLLVLQVSLPGPPRLRPDPEHRGAQVRKLVADVANTYVADLQSYYATSDNDRDSVLLDAGRAELLKARQNYEASKQNTMDFIARLGRLSMPSAPESVPSNPASPEMPGALSGGSESGATDAIGVGSLYTEANRVFAEIKRTEAAEASETSGVKRLVGESAVLPTEDPFLQAQRDRVRSAQRRLDYLTNAQQLASENPQVAAARQEFKEAQEELKQQQQAYIQHLTSDQVDVDAKLAGLRAQFLALDTRIRQSERSIPSKRMLTTRLGYLREAEYIALETLKEAETKWIELRLSAVSGDSRMSVVDQAIPAETGQPGLSRVVIVSLFVTLLLLGLNIALDYLRQSRLRASIARQLEQAPQAASDDEIAAARLPGKVSTQHKR